MDVIAIRRALHEIPETGFQEFKTQRFLLEQLSQMKTSSMEIVEWKTGIIVKIAGLDGMPSIGWRADIDGLPIEEQTGLDYASKHEGYMHACGHDFHMTIALSVVQKIAESPPLHSTIFYFQPAEEGPGGAQPMVDYLRAERPDLLADEIYALHIAPEYPIGTVATRGGLLFANTSELFIDLKGLGGHAAYPHKTKDMSVAAASLLLQLQTIVSRNVDPLDSVVVTIGKMTSGTVQNIIAENARLEGTIRTYSAESMQSVKSRIEAICRGIGISYDCKVQIDFGSMYFEVNNDVQCADHLLQLAEKVNGMIPFESPPAMTGEDFGYFIKEIPGAMFWTGAASEHGLHHAKLAPDEALLELNQIFVEQLMRKNY